MLGFYRAVAELRAYLLRLGRIGCEGESMLAMVANSAAICKNRTGAVGTCDRTNCVV